VEVFLVRQQTGDPAAPPWPDSAEACSARWTALLSPSARLSAGQVVSFESSSLKCRLLGRDASGSWEIEFSGYEDLLAEIERLGRPPLPPYILKARRDRGEAALDRPEDARTYQTTYASVPGAVAAPTAGLHFTPALLEAIREKGVETAELTLLVGPGTFRPVKVEDYTHHRLDPEFYLFPEEARAAVRAALGAGRRIVAVGTTTCRVLEYVAARDLWDRETGWTDVFIYPPYTFQAVGALVTNFHLPRSTLLMLAAAFAGRELVLRAYREAIERRYRFYSYGDATLIV
jgi:S-adenosylmethionine:tRNA ribosyltransferase-isomerase